MSRFDEAMASEQREWFGFDLGSRERRPNVVRPMFQLMRDNLRHAARWCSICSVAPTSFSTIFTFPWTEEDDRRWITEGDCWSDEMFERYEEMIYRAHSPDVDHQPSDVMAGKNDV